MRKQNRATARLGDLVAAVFDEAAEYSKDPEEVSALATRAVAHILRRRAGRPQARRPKRMAIGA